MVIPSRKVDQKYSYADYLNWPDEERWEIIAGVPYLMTPAPLTEHQEVSMALLLQLGAFFQNKSCKVFHAPFDVRLAALDAKDESIENVVQPDIVVICDQSKLDKRGCKGAPDMVIEILSQATAKKDLNEKFNLYERSGIKEYWVVFPSDQALDIYALDEDGKYQKKASFFRDDILKTELFPGLEIDMKDVF